MKKVFLSLCIFVFIATGAGYARAQEEKPFTSGELSKFIADFPEIADHAEQLGEEIGAVEDEPDAWQTIAASSSMAKILKQKGWQPERFSYIISHIGTGLAGLTMAEHQPVINDQLTQAKKAIQDNPNLSDEMKEQMLSQFEQSMGATAQLSKSLDELPDSEVKLIQQNKDKLIQLFDR